MIGAASRCVYISSLRVQTAADAVKFVTQNLADVSVIPAGASVVLAPATAADVIAHLPQAALSQQVCGPAVVSHRFLPGSCRNTSVTSMAGPYLKTVASPGLLLTLVSIRKRREAFSYGLLYALLLLSSWLAPMHILPWVGWHQSNDLCVVLLMGWHFVIANIKQHHLAIPTAVVLLTMVGLVIAVQWLVGIIVFGGDALMLGLSDPRGMVFCGLLASEQTCSLERVLFGLAAVTLVGSFCSVIVMVRVLACGKIKRGYSAFVRRPGGIWEPNHLAALLLMGVASTAYLFESKKLSKVWPQCC